MPELVSFSATVHGRVQGVYFRAFVAEHARPLGITGWTRNLPDGSTVEVHAEGDRAALEKLLAHLKQGPPGARVERIDVEWGQHTRAFTGFEIRH